MSFQHNEKNPPKWMRTLLNWFCDENLVEAIDGDLYEGYQQQLAKWSIAKANRWYFLNLLKFLKPHFMQKLKNTQDFTGQLSGYWKVAIRNIQRHRLSSAINLFGFTLGLTVLLYVGLYLRYELSADNFVPKHEHVYRVLRGYRSQVYSNIEFKNWFESDDEVQLEKLRYLRDMPEVEVVAHFITANSAIAGREYEVEVDGRQWTENEILFSNSPAEFQAIFNWPILAGKLDVRQINGLFITASEAQRIFNPNQFQDVIGRPISIGETQYSIQAVIEDVPKNAHLSFKIAAFPKLMPNTWGAYTYLRLKDGVDVSAIDEKVTAAIYRSAPDKIDDPLEKGYFLQPIKKIHLGSDHLYELEANTNPTYLLIFGVVGLLVLVITCTNYLNMSMAMYTNRLKEIGIRKVIGARKKDVKSQFLFESVFNCLLSLPLSIAVFISFLPVFNQFMNVNLVSEALLEPVVVSTILSITVLMGVVCGIYPAIHLSRKPLLMLMKNKSTETGRNSGLRRTLIGSQFLLLIVLCGFGLYVQQQMVFLQNKDLGYETEGVVYFQMSSVENYKLLKDELSKNPNILEIGSGSVPGNLPYNTATFSYEGVDQVFDDANQLYMDLGAAKALGLKSDYYNLFDDGRKNIALLNENAANRYETVSGLNRQELIGKKFIEAPEDIQDDGTAGYPVVVDGFMEDFNFFSLHKDFNPLIVQVYDEMPWADNVILKLRTDNLFDVIDEVESVYNSVESSNTLKINFLEDRLASLYDREARVADLVSILAVLAIVLAYLGLMGITFYLARRRRKELAIRKVLGAKPSHILNSMLKEYIFSAALAFIIALPITIYFANLWLDAFAFRIGVNPWYLLVLGLASMTLMLLGAGIQSLRTASVNPIEPLRSE